MLCNDNIETSGNITCLPIYMVMFIKPKTSDIGVYKLDLSGLV